MTLSALCVEGFQRVQARAEGMRARVTARLSMGDGGLATHTFNIISGARLDRSSALRDARHECGPGRQARDRGETKDEPDPVGRQAERNQADRPSGD